MSAGRRLRCQRYIWTNNAHAICSRDKYDQQYLTRVLHLAGVYGDPDGNPRIRLRLFDVQTVHVHPELDQYFGLLVVMDGRTIISLYNIIRNTYAPKWDYPDWRYWYSQIWCKPGQQQKSTWQAQPPTQWAKAKNKKGAKRLATIKHNLDKLKPPGPI